MISTQPGPGTGATLPIPTLPPLADKIFVLDEEGAFLCWVWEREAIGERTRDALRHKRSQGQRTGTLPFGYAAPDGIHLVELPEEQAVLNDARTMAASGLSLRMIAARLNDSGRPTRRGTPWRHQYVSNILAA